MTKKLKIALATVVVSIAGLSLAACGGSSDTEAAASPGTQLTSAQTGTTGSGDAGRAGRGGPFAKLTSADIKCLEEQGLTLPSGPPKGSPPNGQDQPGPNSGSGKPGMPLAGNAPSMKMVEEAARACGVDLPKPPPGQPGQSGHGKPGGGMPTKGAPPQGAMPQGKAAPDRG